ncbi:DivIVA domain-containing protein [Arthrobacter sp. CAN_A6]|uniref:DivIVA domain-containing protein n=1 Tax=Arthrobacter sp. CAN_A6 TaxID=2787721 RepID=UPI0018C9DC13
MDSARQGTPFARVAHQAYGYNVRQVDRFLTRAQQHYTVGGSQGDSVTSAVVRSKIFAPARGGYEPRAVDAALDRLEDAFALRERDDLIESKGQDAWLRQIGRQAAVLKGRLNRAPGERFRRPTGRKASAYNVEDVDALCGKLLGYLDNSLPLSVDVVRRSVFRGTAGSEGYEEAQVDAFLDRVVELMTAID